MTKSTRSIVAALALVMTLSAVALANTNMSSWTSKSGRFTVALPSQPQHKADAATAPGGAVTTQHMYTATEVVNGYKYVYVVSYFDCSSLPSTEQTFDHFTGDFARGVQGSIRKQEQFAFGGRPGRWVTVSSEVGTYNLYVIRDGNRLYSLLFGRGAGAPVPANANVFTKSFEILN